MRRLFHHARTLCTRSRLVTAAQMAALGSLAVIMALSSDAGMPGGDIGTQQSRLTAPQATAGVTPTAPAPTAPAPEATPAPHPTSAPEARLVVVRPSRSRPSPSRAAETATPIPTEPFAVSALTTQTPLAPTAAPQATHTPDVPLPTATPRPPAPTITITECPASDMPPMARGLFDAVNGERTKRGLPPLIGHGCIVNIAQQRSNDMAIRNYFAHQSPEGETAFSLMDDVGVIYRWAGEDLARNNYPNADSVSVAISDLMASQGHRDVILSARATHLGVGLTISSENVKYFTAIFIEQP